jgi:hypothetical protein
MTEFDQHSAYRESSLRPNVTCRHLYYLCNGLAISLGYSSGEWGGILCLLTHDYYYLPSRLLVEKREMRAGFI